VWYDGAVMRATAPVAVAVALFFSSASASAQPPPDMGADPPPPPDSKATQPKPPADMGVDPTPLPPPPPPPWKTNVPTSTYGPALVTPEAPAPVAAPTAPAADGKLEERLRVLEGRLDTAEKHERELRKKVAWLEHFKLTGFVQPLFLWTFYDAAASPNRVNGELPPNIAPNDVIAKSDGTTTNPNFFRIRRARLKFEYMPTDFARFQMEIDATPQGGTLPGIGTNARDLYAEGIARWTPAVRTLFRAGIFKIPYGFEIHQTSAERPFIERSWGTLNLFPAERDTGAWARTLAFDDHLIVDVAVVNGQLLGEKFFVQQPDQNKGKDLVARTRYDFGPFEAGASMYYGEGSVVDATNLRLKNFPRWAVGGEAALHHTFVPALGQTRVFSELTFAQNMDRGVRYPSAVPQIPKTIGDDVENVYQRAFFARLEQGMTEWATLLFRYQVYTPDKDNGDRHQIDAGAAVHFTKGLKLTGEYSWAVDNVHAAGQSPPGKHFNTLSAWMEAKF